MFQAFELVPRVWIGLVGLLAVARPERYALYVEPFLNARYVVTGRVSSDLPPAPAHFRLRVVSTNSQEAPRPGRTINVRFVDDSSAIPIVGALIEIGLLGERDGIFLVAPGAQFRVIPPPPDVNNVTSTADSVTLITWTVTTGAGAVAACLLFAAIRSARRRPRRAAG
jgi:hypothetical protein